MALMQFHCVTNIFGNNREVVEIKHPSKESFQEKGTQSDSSTGEKGRNQKLCELRLKCFGESLIYWKAGIAAVVKNIFQLLIVSTSSSKVHFLYLVI